jgi:hypothetical protein
MALITIAATTSIGALALLGLGRYREQDTEISSDGDRYLTMGGGGAVPYPFMWRWLIPALCRTSIARWRLCTDLHLAFLPVLTAVYIAHWQVRPTAAVVGGLLVCGFPGIWRINIRRPVLVDPAALCWALFAAVLSLYGMWPVALAVALVAAAMKETAPAFAACFCLNPLLLLALAGPLIRRLSSRGGEDTHNSQAGARRAPVRPAGYARALGDRRAGGARARSHDRGHRRACRAAWLRAVVRRGEHRAAVPVGGAGGGARRRIGSSPRMGAGGAARPPVQSAGRQRQMTPTPGGGSARPHTG